MKIFRIRRKTKWEFIYNSWSINHGWYADITTIYLTIFGIKIMKLYEYYISYRGEFVKM